MVVRLANCQFMIGQFEKVVNFLAKRINKKANSQMVLPCSLYDLAVKNEQKHLAFYQNIDYCTSDSMLITNYFRHKYQKKISALFNKKYPNQKIFYDYLPKKISQQQELLHYQKILDHKPDFIWIGIGSPKQLAIADWLKNHSQGVKIFCVGAAFDFISGQKKQAPLWMQKNSLEWLFRLLNEPKRLWKRYLVIIPKYLLGQILSNKKNNKT